MTPSWNSNWSYTKHPSVPISLTCMCITNLGIVDCYPFVQTEIKLPLYYEKVLCHWKSLWRNHRSLWLTQISQTSTEIKTTVENYIHIKEWDVINHPCPNFSGDLIKPPLKLGHWWLIYQNNNLCNFSFAIPTQGAQHGKVITSITKYGMKLLIHC